MPPKELVDEIEKAYNEYKKEKEKEVDYLTFYNGFVACNRNRQQENNKLLDVINNQDVKIADLEKENAELKSELTKKADTNHSLVEQMAKLESDFRICEKNADAYYDQLTKATEIIKDQKELLDRVLSGAETLSNFAQNTLRKAEQFIKEIEK